ncbi:hypothetical protein FKM82_003352 [Ascaphus truei]
MYPALRTDLKQELFLDPYENFMRTHLQYYGYFRGLKAREEDFLSRPGRVHHKAGHMVTDSDSDMPAPQEDQKKLIYSLLLETPAFKSRQIVFDKQEGQMVLRLRDPQGLFTASRRNGSMQTPRWPAECEVIKEEIRHIEWVPPVPEVFYQPTGKELMPEVTPEGKGTVLYEISPAYRRPHFAGSRAGGRRCFSKRPHIGLDVQPDNDLQFESRFESGNLQKATRVGMHEYELTLRTDLYTSKHTQWFYFQMKNTRKGVPYRFTITNLMKSSSLFNAGMKPLLYSQQDALLGGTGWRREGKDIKYYKSSRSEDGTTLYSLTWTFEFPHDQDTCYFAHCYPYTYSDLQRDLQSMASDPTRSQYCKLRALCRSLAGNPVYLLTITSPSASPTAACTKKAVVVTARVHPGETNGSWMMKGFLDFLLSDSPDAHLLRDTFIFKVVPMLNPDGVIVGNYRCSLSGRDLNRNYRSMLKDSFPCIWHTRAMIKRLLAEREVSLYCDFHGHSRKSNIFMYGCNNKHQPEAKLHERVFPLMLSKNAPDKFFFKGCKFKVQKGKEGTGRIVMWRQGVRNSYTMESTFGGSTLGNKKGTHFTTEDFKSMGHHFCDTLLDYCDPDDSKFMLCLSELQSLLQEEIRQKLTELGRDLEVDPTLSDLSLSDIESSTSGSNSSESDGLPAHLLNIAQKYYQKKKRLRSRKERNSLYQKCHAKDKAKSRGAAAIKGQEGSLSQTMQVEELPAVPVQAAAKSHLSYTRKQESVSLKTQLINRLPTSYVGDFSLVDNLCHRHVTLKSHEPVTGNRLPLIVTVIQGPSLPPLPKAISPIRQHPLPFDAVLDYDDRRRIADHALKRGKPSLSRVLSTAGTKTYGFSLEGVKQKNLENSSVSLGDPAQSISPKICRMARVRQESIISLVSSGNRNCLECVEGAQALTRLATFIMGTALNSHSPEDPKRSALSLSVGVAAFRGITFL